VRSFSSFSFSLQLPLTLNVIYSADDFHLAALAAYLRLFPFSHLPLDISLRVFLSTSSLPPETQQIDRVMEAFARRWCECNPGVFVAKKKEEKREGEGGGKEEKESDIPYVLAFSMVMLNTDHFNPNAKSKMCVPFSLSPSLPTLTLLQRTRRTKADYVKNTRIDGVAPELLEYLYDQITLAPFIFVDSSSPSSPPSFSNGGVDEFGAPSPSTSSASLLGASVGPAGVGTNFAPSASSSSGFFGGGREKGKVDPYHLIATVRRFPRLSCETRADSMRLQGQTSRFRVDVESHIPAKSPFSFTGTTAFFVRLSLPPSLS
jgi:hypothetical protein